MKKQEELRKGDEVLVKLKVTQVYKTSFDAVDINKDTYNCPKEIIISKPTMGEEFNISACCNASVKSHTIYTCEACGQGCKLAEWNKPQEEGICIHCQNVGCEYRGIKRDKIQCDFYLPALVWR